MWQALEDSAWVKSFGGTGWLYAAVAVIHYMTMFWFIGSMAVVDLRVMGLAAKKRSVLDVAEQFFPWVWTGMTLSSIAGFFMFSTQAGDWAPDKIVHIKFFMILISLAFVIIVRMNIRKWSEAPEIPMWAKAVALLSLLLWIATILSASEIPAMEGLG